MFIITARNTLMFRFIRQKKASSTYVLENSESPEGTIKKNIIFACDCFCMPQKVGFNLF